jgi:triacylglycerol esterase/lipase EstA (alpha/beta hydrolase family)
MHPVRVCISILVALFALAPAAWAVEPQGPALETPEEALRAALECPATFDDSVHDPVLLVHGTFVNSDINWSWSYVPALSSLGFDVCTVDLPNNAIGDIQVSTEYVVFAVREIAARSGDRVDVIGVSQGGIEPRWAIKWWPDVQTSVDDDVMLASPNHGVQWRLPPEFPCMPACWQMANGSNFIAALNAGDETPGDVSYTSIYSSFDFVVTPPEETSPLDGASNILIQDVCPMRPVDHNNMSGDAVTYAIALDALTHPGPADPARIPASTCNQGSMPGARYENGLQPVIDEIASGGPEWEYVTEEPPLKPYAR